MSLIHEFSDSFVVTQYECDASNHMTAGAVLRRAQQVSTDHCDALGLTSEVYARTGTAFLLAKVAVEWTRPIPVGTRVRIVTRPGAPMRAVYTRCTDFLDEAGERLCAMDSRWVLVDVASRRILRNPPEEIAQYFDAKAPYELDVTVHKAAQLEDCGSQTATYTRCDLNRHLNNTIYADIACDCCDVQALLDRGIARFAAVYHKEVPLGMSFEVSRGVMESGSMYFCGQSEKSRHFEAEVTLFGEG